MTNINGIGINTLPTGIIKAADINEKDNITNIVDTMPTEFKSNNLCRNRQNGIRFYHGAILDNSNIKDIDELINKCNLKYSISKKGQPILKNNMTIMNVRNVISFFESTYYKLFNCTFVKSRKNNEWRTGFQLICGDKETSENGEKVPVGCSQYRYQKQLLVKRKLLTQKQLEVILRDLKHNRISKNDADKQIYNAVENNWINKTQGV